VLVSILLASSMAGSAFADEPGRMEQGLFFRFGLGMSALRNLVSVQPEDMDSPLESVDRGLGVSVDIEFGGLLDDGIAMSLFILSDVVATRNSGPDAQVLAAADTLTLGSIGLSITYYVRPSGPWYLRGGIAVSTSGKEGGGFDTSPEAFGTEGFGAFFGGGWEFPVSRSWSLGAASRLHVMQGSGAGFDQDGPVPIDNKTKHHPVSAALMLTTSYNYH
jgi:hypothetical protein